MGEQRVSKERSKQILLEFLGDKSIPLPPIVVYRGAVIERDYVMKEDTVSNHLDELVEEGYVQRVYPSELNNGRIVEVPADTEEDVRGWYAITEKGRQRIERE